MKISAKLSYAVIMIIFTTAIFAKDKPCAPNADFCVQFVNDSSTPAMVQSTSPVGFEMPGVVGLIIPPHTTTNYIPVFGGPQKFVLGQVAPWTLTMNAAYSPLYTNCVMSYNNPVSFKPGHCGMALSQPNPYDLVVKFNLFNLPF